MKYEGEAWIAWNAQADKLEYITVEARNASDAVQKLAKAFERKFPKRVKGKIQVREFDTRIIRSRKEYQIEMNILRRESAEKMLMEAKLTHEYNLHEKTKCELALLLVEEKIKGSEEYVKDRKKMFDDAEKLANG